MTEIQERPGEMTAVNVAADESVVALPDGVVEVGPDEFMVEMPYNADALALLGIVTGWGFIVFVAVLLTAPSHFAVNVSYSILAITVLMCTFLAAIIKRSKVRLDCGRQEADVETRRLLTHFFPTHIEGIPLRMLIEPVTHDTWLRTNRRPICAVALRFSLNRGATSLLVDVATAPHSEILVKMEMWKKFIALKMSKKRSVGQGELREDEDAGNSIKPLL